MSDAVRTRREPPPFRRVRVQRTERVTPRMARITLAGDDLHGLVVHEPAASIRLLLPSPGADELVIPTWNGNEFLLPDGTRPVIRTFTPGRVDPAGPTLDIDVVLHGHGAASTWAAAAAAQPGSNAEAAVSGPGRGYTVDPAAPAFLLAGDETAIPAITQLLDAIPPDTPRQVLIEIGADEARQPLPATWLPAGSLPDAVAQADIPDGAHVWAAGEAAVMQRIRRHLFDERGIPRDRTEIRGYWKVRSPCS